MKIAILQESFPEAPSHADPVKLAAVLTSAGHGVDFISADQLADEKQFNADRYQLVVLPYGPYFPAAARENFLAFLRAGGDFLSTGGYAFDAQAVKYNGRWYSAEDAAREIPTNEIIIGSQGDSSYLTGEWHDREPAVGAWGDQKATKRWTGKSAGLRLVADPARRYMLHVYLMANESTKHMKRRLLLDGRLLVDIPCEAIQELKVPLGPEQFKGKKEHNLVFDCQLWRPKDLGQNTDTRRLGVAVGRVKLVPQGPYEPAPDLSQLSACMNMRRGKPADFLEWEEPQLGVFDAGYRLRNGNMIEPASGEHVVPTDFRFKGKVEGWAAAGVTGSGWYWTMPAHRSRLIPLLQVKDGFGRYCGNAGSLMVNHDGPYKSSTWAFFGVESVDIFAKSGGDKLLLWVVDAMKRGVFTHGVYPSYPCFHQGEETLIEVKVSNFSAEAAAVKVAGSIRDESGDVVFSQDIDLTLAPGGTKEVPLKWKPESFRDDFYTVTFDTVIGGRVIDTQRTGFYVWDKAVAARGMDLSYSSNYLRDGGRPRYMLGVQAFYDKVAKEGMDPLDIERDFAQMADMGIHVARSFTYFKESEYDRRFIDALVMASQRHRVAFFLTNTVFMETYLNDPSGSKAPQELADRYKGIPGVMIDLQNEPNFGRQVNKARDVRFNEYLKGIYPSADALKAAWGDELKPDERLGAVRCDWMTNDWTSVRSRDTYRFLLDEGSRWTGGVTGLIKSEDLNRLVSCGYLQWWPDMVMDPAATSDGLDFVDRHWYGRMHELDRFDAMLAISDRRYCGKAPSIGEFGSKTFPTFAESGHNYDTELQQEERYLHIGHYTFALGGLFASNWHWRDPGSCIFPYGIVHSDFVPKPVTRAYRGMSLLFSTLKPKYVPPQTYLVLPDESRFGGGSERIFEAIMRAANGLMDAQIPFGVIGEWDLAKLPEAAKLLFVPSPFALSDQGYEHLRKFVENGGTLYISGDFSFDENRKRTKTARLEELAGVRFIRERYQDVNVDKSAIRTIDYTDNFTYRGSPAMEFEPLEDALVIAQTGERPVAVDNHYGSGRVRYSADPAEFSPGAPLSTIYRRMADMVMVPVENVTSNVPGIQVFRITLDDGGEAMIIGNTSDKQVRVKVRLGGHDYSIGVAAGRQAVLVNHNGNLTGLEAQGDVLRNGKPVVKTSSHFFMVSLDDRDIASSNQLAFIPLRSGSFGFGAEGLVAQAGEVRDKGWRKLSGVGRTNGIINVPQGMAGEIVLVADPGQLSEAGRIVADVLAK